MITKWTSHLQTPEEKEQFEKELRGHKLGFDRLLQIMSEDLEGLEAAEVSQKAYDLPNWDYRQADCAGAKRCLRRYMKLLTLDQQERS